MASKLPVVSGKKLVKALRKNGYKVVRQRGSHVFIESPDGTCGSVIPVHGNEDLGLGLLKSILNDFGLEVDEILKMLNR